MVIYILMIRFCFYICWYFGVQKTIALELTYEHDELNAFAKKVFRYKMWHSLQFPTKSPSNLGNKIRNSKVLLTLVTAWYAVKLTSILIVYIHDPYTTIVTNRLFLLHVNEIENGYGKHVKRKTTRPKSNQQPKALDLQIQT